MVIHFTHKHNFIRYTIIHNLASKSKKFSVKRKNKYKNTFFVLL